MLKRNGEPCQYQVPGFAGRLTATEHGAYTEAVASVDDHLRQLNEAVTALTEIERQSARASGLECPSSPRTLRIQHRSPPEPCRAKPSAEP